MEDKFIKVQNEHEVKKGDFVKIIFGSIGRGEKEYRGILETYRKEDYNNGMVKLENGRFFCSSLGFGDWLKVYKLEQA